MSHSQHPPRPSDYYAHLKTETGVYANITFILDKIEEDADLSTLTAMFRTMFEKETAYAVSGRLTRAAQGALPLPRLRLGVPNSLQRPHFSREPETHLSVPK